MTFSRTDWAALIRRAFEATPAATDDADDRDEKPLIDAIVDLALADLAESTEELARLYVEAEATRHVKRARRPGNTSAAGQLCNADGETYDWEPYRLLADDDARVVQQQDSILRHRLAERRRQRKSIADDQRQLDRRQSEDDAYTSWREERIIAGAPPRTLTFGAFVRDAGWLTEDSED